MATSVHSVSVDEHGNTEAGIFIMRHYLSRDNIKDGNEIPLKGNRIVLKE